jgi:PKD repeat protein
VAFSSSTSSGDPTDWEWDFGGGNTAVGSPTASFTFDTPGTYSVVLKVINLAGTDTDTCAILVTATPTPTSTSTGSATASASATPTPVPTCAYPPNVIGQSPATAQANVINAGFNVVMNSTLTNGAKDKIQAQNPDHTQCKSLGSTVTLFYRPN